MILHVLSPHRMQHALAKIMLSTLSQTWQPGAAEHDYPCAIRFIASQDHLFSWCKIRLGLRIFSIDIRFLAIDLWFEGRNYSCVTKVTQHHNFLTIFLLSL